MLLNWIDLCAWSCCLKKSESHFYCNHESESYIFNVVSFCSSVQSILLVFWYATLWKRNNLMIYSWKCIHIFCLFVVPIIKKSRRFFFVRHTLSFSTFIQCWCIFIRFIIFFFHLFLLAEAMIVCACVSVCLVCRFRLSFSFELLKIFSSILVPDFILVLGFTLLKFYAKLLRKYHCYCEDTMQNV